MCLIPRHNSLPGPSPDRLSHGRIFQDSPERSLPPWPVLCLECGSRWSCGLVCDSPVPLSRVSSIADTIRRRYFWTKKVLSRFGRHSGGCLPPSGLFPSFRLGYISYTTPALFQTLQVFF